ncbi:class II fructose-1,6-bisphosphate aldolase [Clostridium sp. cel8]|jgi:fructose-bisphosphate aldolase, class II|uniref:class II fructose-1,6-bisphosphate aldolase n=1 Tax=unclassified Clostridium TaxID=2614128 RepID=UPI0015F5096D|nr:class II fructose-1,6-bisphosphate aldolase [Clostridium sp. cel8]MBA5851374.1 class II fructose-1,6-bisphosphate aldolase [Clostridium sp. cel8]
MALVTTKEMFKKAYAGKYSIGAFNINNLEILQGVIRGAKAKNSAVIIQCSAGAIKYAGPKYIQAMVNAAVDESGIDAALHLDHGPDLDTVKLCIEHGFTSVMFDGSHFDYDENVKKTKEVVEYAHAHGVVVEAELGVLAGVEDDVSADEHIYTDPDQAKDFVEKTGIDSLAIAIGTSHGAFKFPPNFKPSLRFDILEKVQEKLPNFPIVLHGASAVDPEAVNTCNKYGGNIANAKGIPVDMLRKASSMAVCKINMDTDLRLAMTAAVRKTFGDHPEIFDPRKYLGAGRDYIQKVVEDKIDNVLGSANSLD